MIRDAARLLDELRRAHAAIRDSVLAACEHQAMDALATPVAEDAGDTIFALDRVSEAALVEHFEPIAGAGVRQRVIAAARVSRAARRAGRTWHPCLSMPEHV